MMFVDEKGRRVGLDLQSWMDWEKSSEALENFDLLTVVKKDAKSLLRGGSDVKIKECVQVRAGANAFKARQVRSQ
jgi:hypothetical protein